MRSTSIDAHVRALSLSKRLTRAVLASDRRPAASKRVTIGGAG